MTPCFYSEQKQPEQKYLKYINRYIQRRLDPCLVNSKRSECSALLTKRDLSSLLPPFTFELLGGVLSPCLFLSLPWESVALCPLPGSHSQLPVPSDPVTSTAERRACTPGAGAADLRACSTLPHSWNVQLASSAVCSEAGAAVVWGRFSLPAPGAPSAPMPCACCLACGALDEVGAQTLPASGHPRPPE